MSMRIGVLAFLCISMEDIAYTEQRVGSLFYDERSKRIDIHFGLEKFFGGLHCGTGMEVMLDGKKVSTRIEKNIVSLCKGQCIKADSELGTGPFLPT